MIFMFLFNKTAVKQKAGEPAAKAEYDEALAKRLGADERGIQNYVLMILKTGPNKIPADKKHNKMFAKHFANITRLAKEKKLAVAGPLNGIDGWKGLFIFAISVIEEAKKLTETDPVIIKSEMVAEYHKYYSSARLMIMNKIHGKIARTGL